MGFFSKKHFLYLVIVCCGFSPDAGAGGATMNDFASGFEPMGPVGSDGYQLFLDRKTGDHVRMQTGEPTPVATEQGIQCPPGKRSGGRYGECLPIDEEKSNDRDDTNAGVQRQADDEAARRRAACVARVQQAAASCEGSKSSAGRSCDANSHAQLNALNAEGEQINRELQNEATKKAACDRNGDYQRRVGEATRQFQGTCQQAASSCSSTCEQVPASAQGCADDSRVRAALSSAQQSGSYCSGDLQTRASQAGQQARGQSNTAASSQLCSSVASASEDATPTQAGAGADSITPPSTGTGPADLSAGPSPDYMKDSYDGESMLTATAPEGGAKMKTGTDGKDELGSSGNPAMGGLGDLPTRQSHAGGGGFGGGGDFQGTPGFSGEGEAEGTAVAASKRAAILGEASGGGSGGRKGGRRMTRYGVAGLAAEGDTTRLPSSVENHEGSPDLRKFLPHMRGARRVAGLASLGIHPAETNFFSKIHERYVALSDTFESDPPAVVKRLINLQKRQEITLLCPKLPRPES